MKQFEMPEIEVVEVKVDVIMDIDPGQDNWGSWA